jgi:hypothetical protein
MAPPIKVSSWEGLNVSYILSNAFHLFALKKGQRESRMRLILATCDT